jgi:S1-C subfamily serine protease
MSENVRFPEDDMSIITEMHEKMLYPTVLVEGAKGRGSGTVLYSKENPDEPGTYLNYVLTNHHVVAPNIQTGKVWNPLTQQEEKKDVFSTVDVYFYKYKYESRNIGKNSVEADIVAYTKEEDLALLKLRSIEKIENVAQFFPLDEIKNLRIFMKTHAVGASLGHQPIATEGKITCMSDEIENYVYWMSSAQIIFGNSGGSMYLELDGDYFFIGVPSQVSVNFVGWSASAVTHMGYFIPIDRVCAFLDRNFYGFVYDEQQSKEQCDADRERVRKIAKAQQDLKSLEA